MRSGHTACDAAPVLDAPEQDLGCMSLFVEGFSVAELSSTDFAWLDAGSSAFVLQRDSEPVSIVATVGYQVGGVRQRR